MPAVPQSSKIRKGGGAEGPRGPTRALALPLNISGDQKENIMRNRQFIIVSNPGIRILTRALNVVYTIQTSL